MAESQNNRSPFAFRKIYGKETVSNTQIIAYAVHMGRIILLDLFGAVEAVESARGHLLDKDALYVNNVDVMQSVVMLGEKFIWQKTIFDTARKSNAIIASYALGEVLPPSVANYTYVMGRLLLPDPNDKRAQPERHLQIEDDPDTVAMVGQRLTKIVKIGILPEWYEPIIRGIRTARERSLQNLISPTSCGGCYVWAISTDSNLWTEYISNLVKNGTLSITEGAQS